MLSSSRASLRPLTLIVAALAGSSAHAIVGGTLDTATSVYQYTGNYNNGSFFGAQPIAPNWLITVKHIGPTVGNVFSNSDGFYTVDQVVSDPNSDISLMHVNGTFAHYYTYGAVTNAGTNVTVYGYGPHSAAVGTKPNDPDGNRYLATNSIDAIYNINFPGQSSFQTYEFDLDDGSGTHNSTGGTIPTASEGGVLVGDSGGGWFTNYGYALPTLVAMSSASASESDFKFDPNNPGANQGANTELYQAGATSFGVNLSAYASFIQSTTGIAPVTPRATPEPATFAALGLGALAVLRRRRRA